MLIEELRLKNFGKFIDKSIVLEDGINIIYGDNEAGKSTIHDFIKGMLFGIVKARGRVAKEDLYMRYLPWNNPSLYQGSMQINIENKKYRLIRNFHKDYKEFRIIDLVTGREYRSFSEIDSTLLPMLNETNYKNTISISQKKAGTDKEFVSEVQNYIANLSTSKDSEVNISNALSYLQAKKKQIESNNTRKRINELTLFLKDCENERKKIEEYAKELVRLDQRIKTLMELINDKLQVEDKISSVQIKLSQGNEIDSRRLSLDLLEYEELMQKEKELESHQALLDTNYEKENGVGTEDVVKRMPKWILTYLYMPILATILAMLTNSLHHKGILLSLLIWVGYGSVGVLTKLYLFNRYEKEEVISDHKKIDLENQSKRKEQEYQQQKSLLERKEKILDYYKVQGYEELKTFTLRISQSGTIKDELRKEHQSLKNQLEEIDNKAYLMSQIILGEAKNREVEKEINSNPSLIQLLNYANQCDRLQYERIKWELERLEVRQDEVYESQKVLKQLNLDLQVEMDELKAVDLASETIENLAIQIHDSFGLKLSKTVSDIISKITSNRYTDVRIDEKLNIKVLDGEEYIPIDNLSVGTIEQVYLAMRMEVSTLFFEKEEVPFILDDCFAYYDDKRLEETLRTLYNKRNQIIIFTCHKRESKILDTLEIPYHLISLT
ncbi:ATP-binding protein [Anaeromicropila herbilytica]|uniref:Rad50/SbcC-type AAA domain-containing protein n=1 Tax=Anaeromicropila herbilytica TaxID=2785025 RepID=A0A7R7ICH5_9FIRM|nr:AAA family ATPase [Anaeromicropila herbilytica]BCN28958.1 hypothetical protein bsdtb5_02530 [Anaeromicropila herbilytica]